MVNVSRYDSDATANPYLAFSAMLMAGLDGIQNKPSRRRYDKDLYDLPPEELSQIPTVCGSLREALESSNHDRSYLLRAMSSLTIKSMLTLI